MVSRQNYAERTFYTSRKIQDSRSRKIQASSPRVALYCFDKYQPSSFLSDLCSKQPGLVSSRIRTQKVYHFFPNNDFDLTWRYEIDQLMLSKQIASDKNNNADPFITNLSLSLKQHTYHLCCWNLSLTNINQSWNRIEVVFCMVQSDSIHG